MDRDRNLCSEGDVFALGRRQSPTGHGEFQMKTTFAALAFILATAAAACNTVEGAGQDVQAAGQAIEDTAEDVRN